MISNRVLELEWICKHIAGTFDRQDGFDMIIHRNKGILEEEIDDNFVILSKLILTHEKKCIP